MIEEISIAGIFKLVAKLGPRLIYPGIPFYLVPILLAGAITAQFESGLTHHPSDAPAVLDLPMGISQSAKESPGRASLLVIPETTQGFFLEAENQGIDSAWLSVPISKFAANEDRVDLASNGLSVEPLHGVAYPLALVVAGSHKRSIDPSLGESRNLAALEVATARSNWISLFLLGGAVFGFGASTSFANDRSVVEKENSSVDKGHEKRQS